MGSDLLTKLEPFFKKYNPLFFKKGHIIARPEDTIEYMYFLEKGFVKFYVLSKTGKELTFLIYSPGYIFPILYTFFGNETRYYFEALTPIMVRRAPREVFTEVISKDPESLLLLSREMVLRLQELLNRLELLTLGDASQNVAFILSDCARQFGIKKANSYTITVPLVHKDIASMAGLSRETVSIEMKKFEEKGLISYRRKHIFIKDLKKFKEALDINI